MIFGSVAAHNLILRRNHIIEIDGRSGFSDIADDSCRSGCRIGARRKEEATIWDIGGGFGFHFPVHSYIDFSFSGEGHYSIFTSKFNTNALSLREGESTRGTGWGLTFQGAFEFPVLQKFIVLGLGAYYKYHQITFRNTDGRNSGFLYSTLVRLDTQQGYLVGKKSRLVVHSVGIYISAFYLSFLIDAVIQNFSN